MSRQPEDPIFNRIEEFRNKKGLSRQQLADAVEVHYQTVGYLERGEYNPSLSLALKISEELETSVGEIFSLTPFRKARNNG
ncbi:MAG: helix-turn-helix transcriptional regulator [Candidatus Nanopelagicaceae bacterium]|jgi:DNA-binding XRE family transcriptional regulator|nr:helix-turn-helix transcriptional regulator [Candidatus Nanopelagicaceae bacterium]